MNKQPPSPYPLSLLSITALSSIVPIVLFLLLFYLPLTGIWYTLYVGFAIFTALFAIAMAIITITSDVFPFND